MTDTRIPVSPIEAVIQAMPLEETQRTAVLLWNALQASNDETRHMQRVFGGWDDCPGCQAANDECDGSRCCDASKERQRIVRDAWGLK